MERIFLTTGRNNCGGRCVIKAHVKDGTIVLTDKAGTETAVTKTEEGYQLTWTAEADPLIFELTEDDIQLLAG